MPMIGLGTDKIFDVNIITKAITDIGYRTLDTASRYNNEDAVGKAVLKAIESGTVKREELFIITKVWMDEVEDVEAACRRSLERLNLEYIDLYLLHWPVFTRLIEEPSTDRPAIYSIINLPVHKVWPQLERLVALGLVRSIGVSNFCVQSLWDLLSYAEIKPLVNEVEIHPLFN